MFTLSFARAVVSGCSVEWLRLLVIVDKYWCYPHTLLLGYQCMMHAYPHLPPICRRKSWRACFVTVVQSPRGVLHEKIRATLDPFKPFQRWKTLSCVPSKSSAKQDTVISWSASALCFARVVLEFEQKKLTETLPCCAVRRVLGARCLCALVPEPEAWLTEAGRDKQKLLQLLHVEHSLFRPGFFWKPDFSSGAAVAS